MSPSLPSGSRGSAQDPAAAGPRLAGGTGAVDLRMLDPAEDLAMLAVDLRRHGAAWADAALYGEYLRLSGDALPAVIPAGPPAR
jgi:hypothetical protein